MALCSVLQSLKEDIDFRTTPAPSITHWKCYLPSQEFNSSPFGQNLPLTVILCSPVPGWVYRSTWTETSPELSSSLGNLSKKWNCCFCLLFLKISCLFTLVVLAGDKVLDERVRGLSVEGQSVLEWLQIFWLVNIAHFETDTTRMEILLDNLLTKCYSCE